MRAVTDVAPCCEERQRHGLLERAAPARRLARQGSIHHSGGRAAPFVTINCGAIPEALLEVGSVRVTGLGAFPGRIRFSGQDRQVRGGAPRHGLPGRRFGELPLNLSEVLPRPAGTRDRQGRRDADGSQWTSASSRRRIATSRRWSPAARSERTCTTAWRRVDPAAPLPRADR